MNTKNKIVFQLEGPAQKDHHLELSVFAEKSKQFSDFLKASAAAGGAGDLSFRTVALSHSSPTTVECELIGKESNSAAVALNSIRDNLDLVAQGKAGSLSPAVLHAVEKLTEPDSQKILRPKIQIISDDYEDECVYELNDHFRKSLLAVQKEEENVISTVDGKLEEINIHKDLNTFRIYLSVPRAASVSCKFPSDLLEKVQGALGRYVSVSGECTYHFDNPVPYKIDVQEIEVLPPSDELPSLMDLYGIAPDATGEKSAVEFVRELRDNWDKKI